MNLLIFKFLFIVFCLSAGLCGGIDVPDTADSAHVLWENAKVWRLFC